MKLPSLNNLLHASKNSFERFPLTIFSAIIAVFFAIYMVEYSDEITNIYPYINGMLTAALGIPLFFCAAVFTSMENSSSTKKRLFTLAAFLILIAIYFSLPSSENANSSQAAYIRYIIYNIIIHLLVSFVPYLKTQKMNGFWNYNKILFIRLWTSVLYSSVLYFGIIIALFAIESLFPIDFHNELYFDIYIFIIGIFNTWFFVSGIPTDLHALEKENTYPKGLKVFTQFILLPLLILYLSILYIYTAKICITWDWPKGIVSYLISGVSILGILAILLIHPFSNSNENSWIKKFSKIYYYLLFPLIFVLFFAITIRINDYGITVNRYLIFILGVWLFVIATYFSIGKTNIKFVPQTLALMLAVLSFGPWGMFSVSEKSQTTRLLTLLENAKLTSNHKTNNEVILHIDSLQKFNFDQKDINQSKISDSIHNEIYSIFNYLNQYHSCKKIETIFQQNIDSILTLSKEKNKYTSATDIYMKALGLRNSKIYNTAVESNPFFYFNAKKSDFTKINGYTYLIPIHYYQNEKTMLKINLDDISFTEFPFKTSKKIYQLKINQSTFNFSLDKILIPLFETYGNEQASEINPTKMTLFESNSEFDLKLEISSINISSIKNKRVVNSFNANLFIRKKATKNN